MPRGGRLLHRDLPPGGRNRLASVRRGRRHRQQLAPRDGRRRGAGGPYFSSAGWIGAYRSRLSSSRSCSS